MILFFDTYISNNPLFVNSKNKEINKLIRPSDSIFHEVDKVDIFNYTIQSFIHSEFKEIIINVEFENLNDKYRFFNMYTNNEKVKINNSRSSCKDHYIEKFMKFDENEWILFSPNNDHPYIANKSGVFEKIEKFSNECLKKYNKHVTIFYSHFTECQNFINKNQYLSSYPGNKVKLIEENDDFYLVEFDHFQFSSIQILQVKFLLELLKNIPDNKHKIIRIEDVAKFHDNRIPVLSIIPKYEICRHYDTYIHTIFFYKKPISSIIVPPLFIPKGFFEKKIKIKYGYDKIYKDFININPNSKLFSFIDKENGYDMIETIDNIPISWLDRIEVLDINPYFITNYNLIADRSKRIINPWGKISNTELLINKLFRMLYDGKIYQYYIFLLNKFFWKSRLKKIIND